MRKLEKVFSCNGDELCSHVKDVVIRKEQLVVKDDVVDEVQEVMVVQIAGAIAIHPKIKRDRVEAIYPSELREEINTRVLKAKELRNVLILNRNLKREVHVRDLSLWALACDAWFNLMATIQSEEVMSEVLV